MNVFLYDKTFEGLLSAVFEAYRLKIFPELLLETNAPLPLFYDHTISIGTDEEKSGRVWKGLQKKLSGSALSMLSVCWLSELPEIDILLFRYIRKAIDSPISIELNFGDPDVLELSKIWKKVDHERSRVIQFTRFQKTADQLFFAASKPLYNVLPLTITHFKDRFADQTWIVYDLKRDYGYYYDLSTVTEMQLDASFTQHYTNKLDEHLLAEDEKLFQKLWQEYFKSIAIKERRNPKLHRQFLPARFWKYLTEKQ